MRKITSINQLKAILRKDKVIIRVLPFHGEKIMRELCPDCIELPKSFSSIEELQNWRDFLKSKTSYKVFGRSYVIDLILGKSELGKGNLSVSGNILTLSPYSAINYLTKRVSKEAISKILDYSIITLRNYSTYISGLLNEGIRLHEKGKLDESLRTFNKFRRILFVKENEASDPIELLKRVYKGGNLREDWQKLSPIWKELIYYLIDASLGLLPGKSKEIIEKGVLDYSSDRVEDFSEIPYPEYVDVVNQALAELIRGNDVIIIGSLKSGKSTISDLIKNRAKELDFNVHVIDYHDSNGNYTSIEKLRKIGERNVYVLTPDLLKTLGINAFKINVDKRYSFAVSKMKGITFRFDKSVALIPSHYIINYQKSNIEETIESALQNFYSDYWEYVYNVIFDADPNKILWYLPILAVYDKYLTPIPAKISSIILTEAGRKNVNEEDLVLKWFSNVQVPFKVPRSDDYFTKEIDNVNVNELLKNSLKKVLDTFNENDLFNVLNVHVYMTIKEGKKPELTNSVKSIFDNNLAFIHTISPLITNELINKISSDVVCNYLGENLQPYEQLTYIKIALAKRCKTPYDVIQILNSVVKRGKSTWLKFVLDELMQNEELLKNRAYDVAVLLFNYLKYTDEDLDKVRRILKVIENETEYSVFPKSIVSYHEGSLNDVYSSNPSWNLFILGYLGIYALTSHDLVKLAILYDKFRKTYLSTRNLKCDEKLKDFFQIEGNVCDYIEEVKDRLDAGIGYTLLLTHPKEESARATVELAEKLTINWYNRLRNKIYKEKNAKENEIMDLLKIYQIRLLKSLISGEKYEYKSVLQDIADLENLINFVKKQDMRGAILVASSISKKILGEKETPKVFGGTTLDLLIYVSADILLNNAKNNEFFEFVTSQIKNKESGIDKALMGIITSVIHDNKQELEKALEYARENFYSAMLEVLSKYVNNKKMFVVSLIPYVGIWHILGSE